MNTTEELIINFLNSRLEHPHSKLINDPLFIEQLRTENTNRALRMLSSTGFKTDTGSSEKVYFNLPNTTAKVCITHGGPSTWGTGNRKPVVSIQGAISIQDDKFELIDLHSDIAAEIVLGLLRYATAERS